MTLQCYIVASPCVLKSHRFSTFVLGMRRIFWSLRYFVMESEPSALLVATWHVVRQVVCAKHMMVFRQLGQLPFYFCCAVLLVSLVNPQVFSEDTEVALPWDGVRAFCSPCDCVPLTH